MLKSDWFFENNRYFLQEIADEASCIAIYGQKYPMKSEMTCTAVFLLASVSSAKIF